MTDPSPSPTDPAKADTPDAAASTTDLVGTLPAVTVIGTGHVLPVAGTVRDLILDTRADAVAVELDRARLQALLEGPEQRGGGALGFLARLQDRLSEDLGGEVGEDMLAGREAALALGVPLFCIDDPADATVRRAWKAMTWRERGRLMVDLVRTMFPGAADDDIQRVLQGDPSIIQEFRDRYPELAKEVLDARDQRMAERVRRILDRLDRVAVVVGDAHAPGVAQRLEEAGHEVTLHRLKDVLDRKESGWTATASFELRTPPADEGERITGGQSGDE